MDEYLDHSLESCQVQHEDTSDLLKQVLTHSLHLRAQFSEAWRLWQEKTGMLSAPERTMTEDIMQRAQLCLTRCNDATEGDISDMTGMLPVLLSEIQSSRQQISSVLLLLRSYGGNHRDYAMETRSELPSQPPPAYSEQQHSSGVLNTSARTTNSSNEPHEPQPMYAELPGDNVLLSRDLQRQSYVTGERDQLSELDGGYFAWRQGMPVHGLTYTARTSGLRPQQRTEIAELNLDHATAPLQGRPDFFNPTLIVSTSNPDPDVVLKGRARSRQWLKGQASRSKS